MKLQAVILAGGLGTRIRAVLGDTPKSLAPVRGRPFLVHVLEELGRQGFRDVVLAVGSGGEAVRRTLGPACGAVSLRYSQETSPLGTGGAARRALELAEPGPCVVMNGDTWADIDYADLLRSHAESGARLSMAVVRLADVSRFGALSVAEGTIRSFEEKGRGGPGLVSAGVYAMAHDLLADAGLPAAFSIERDFIMARVRELAPRAYERCGRFIDIGVPEDYARAQVEVGAR